MESPYYVLLEVVVPKLTLNADPTFLFRLYERKGV